MMTGETLVCRGGAAVGSEEPVCSLYGTIELGINNTLCIAAPFIVSNNFRTSRKIGVLYIQFIVPDNSWHIRLFNIRPSGPSSGYQFPSPKPQPFAD